VLFDFGRHNGRDGSAVSTAPLLLFYASDWAGPSNSWNSRTGSQSLGYDTHNGSAPSRGSSTIDGVAVDTAVFDGNDFFTFIPYDNPPTGRPWAGLKEFSLSLVFKTGAAGQSGVNDFWQQRGIVGFERGGAGQGEFAIGLHNDGSARPGYASYCH